MPKQSHAEMQTPTEKPIQTFTREDAKKIAICSLRSSYDVNNHLEKLAKKHLPEAIAAGQDAIEGEVAKTMDTVSIAYSIESGHILLESVGKRLRPLALEMKKNLEQEFGCQKIHERALVDQAVNAYIRKLEYSKLMVEYREPEWLGHEKIAILSFYSKETDRAHRQFLSALEILKAIKQPALKVNIKAQNTFVAQNQQINNPSEKINEAT